MTRRLPKSLLVLALVAVVGMAFRVSWNAQRDVATAIGADPVAALFYPIVVDGLMALALVATLTLTGRDRRFALRVLAGYTLASLVLNYVHGLVDLATGRGVLADWAPANWALVLLASSLPVGAIFFGSDLVAKVLHHQPDTTTAPTGAVDDFTGQQPSTYRSIPDMPEHGEAPLPATAAEPSVAPSPSQDASPESVTATSAMPVDETPPEEPTAPSPPAPAPSTSEPDEAGEVDERGPVGRPVPAAARSGSPSRSVAELLIQARTVTADWPVEELTGERIRKAVRTSSARARSLREVLRAERAELVEVAA